MYVLVMVKVGEVTVPVEPSPLLKLLTRPVPWKPETVCWSGRVPVAGAVPKAVPVVVQSP